MKYKKHKIITKESYTEDKPGEYTFWSASDLVNKDEHIPLVKLIVDSDGNITVKPIKNFTDDYYVFSDNDINSKYRFDLDGLYTFLLEAIKKEKESLSTEDLNKINSERSKKGISITSPKKEIKQITKYLKEFGYEVMRTDAFDKESYDITKSVVNTAIKSNKDLEYILNRIDKTLNHNDPYFSVEFDRSIVNNGVELIAAQTLRTIVDDLKNFVNRNIDKPDFSEENIVNAYKTITGVNYYTDKIENVDYYNNFLMLQGIDYTDKLNYELPKENKFLQSFKNFTENLIEKLLLKKNPNFYEE